MPSSLLALLQAALLATGTAAAPRCNSQTGLITPVPCCAPPAPVCCRGGGVLGHAFDGTAARPYCLHTANASAAVAPAPLPLLVYLHDAGESVAQIYERTSLVAQASRFSLSPGLRGFALALPQARGLLAPATGSAGCGKYTSNPPRLAIASHFPGKRSACGASRGVGLLAPELLHWPPLFRLPHG